MNNSVAIIIGFRKVFSNVIVTAVTLDPVRCVTRSLSFTRQVTSIVTSEMCDRVLVTPEPEQSRAASCGQRLTRAAETSGSVFSHTQERQGVCTVPITGGGDIMFREDDSSSPVMQQKHDR